jgi:hypothetical protein
MTYYEENKYLNTKCVQVFLNAYVIPINFRHTPPPPPQYLLTLQQNILLPSTSLRIIKVYCFYNSVIIWYCMETWAVEVWGMQNLC